MHDSRDNEDMPAGGWFLNVNNLAYREALEERFSFSRRWGATAFAGLAGLYGDRGVYLKFGYSW